MSGTAPAWQRRAYSIDAMRGLARGALPRPVFDFADGGAEDELTLRRNEAAFDDLRLLPQPLNGAATRDLSVTLFGKRLSLPVIDRPDRTCRAVLARWRALRCARGGGGRHRLLPQPWLGLHPRGSGGDRRRAALDAGVRLPRSRLHARTDRARGGGRLRRAGAHHRQSDARQSRARHPQRLRRSRRASGRRHIGRHGAEGRLALAHAQRVARASPSAIMRGPASPPISTRLAGRMASLLDPSMSWEDVEDLAQASGAGRSSSRACCIRRRRSEAVDHGVDGIIVSNHGGRQLDGAPASHRGAARRASRRSSGTHSGARRWRHPARHRRGQGAGARRHRLPDGTAAALGPRGRGRGRRRPCARHLPARDRPRAWASAASAASPPSTDICSSPNADRTDPVIKDPPLLTIRRDFPRPTAAQVAAFADVPTGYAVDAMDGRGALDYRIKPLAPMQSQSMVGVAITCHCGPADNLALFGALAAARAGRHSGGGDRWLHRDRDHRRSVDGHGAQSRRWRDW